MTSVASAPPSRLGRSPSAPSPVPALVTALGFVVCYLLSDQIAGRLASGAMPQPAVAAAEARGWFETNGTAVAVLAGFQALSIVFLARYVVLLPRVRQAAGSGLARLVRVAGLVAVAAMAVSCVLSVIIAAAVESLSTEAFGLLRAAAFVAGGTAHVLALGLFVLAASRLPGTSRPVRVLAIVAAVPAVGSLISLLVYEGAVLILVGRLLCMAWVVVAAVSLLRRPGGRPTGSGG